MLTNELEKKLIGSKLNWIKRSCDLVMFDFTCINQEKVNLHTQCFLRILDNGKLIISSNDLYRRGKNSKKKFKWDKPGTTLFEDNLDLYQSKIYSKFVVEINLINSDVTINFEDGLKLELIVDTTETEEKYRFFSKDDVY